MYFYVDSQLLSIVIIEWVDNSDSQSDNKPVQRSPNEPEETKIKPVTLCAHGGYKANFEACFVDLGCLEKHNFSTVLLENSRKHGKRDFPSILIRLLHFGSFPDWGVVVQWQC